MLPSARFLLLWLPFALAASVLLLACGGDSSTTPAPAPAPPPAPPPPPPPEPEPEPPAAPAGLHVSATGLDFIEWSWTPVEGADGYDVQFTANEAFTDEDEIIARTAEATSYRREDLAPGTSYSLRVRSAAGSGEERITSAWSAQAGGATHLPEPPAAPAGLHVSATGLDFIEWSWTPVEGADGYDVQFTANEAFTDEDEIIARTAEATSYRREDLAPGTSYSLRVRSAAGSGEERITSAWSAHAGGATHLPEPPAAPAGLHVSATGLDFIEWSWTPVEGADGYDVQFTANEAFTDEDEIIARTAEATSYRREDLAPGTSYSLRVRSAAGSGEERITSAWSAQAGGATHLPEPPAAPAGLHVSATGLDFIEWSWTPVEGADGYDVQFTANEAFTDEDEIIARTAEETSYRRGDLESGTSYSLRVRAAAGTGEERITSAWSAQAGGATGLPEPPAAPAGLHVSGPARTSSNGAGRRWREPTATTFS